jgi:hypothetical protein
VNEPLEFRARERHPFVYLGTAFGVIFTASGIVVIIGGASSLLNLVVGLFALGFGGAILVSAAYAIWGRLRLGLGDDGWCTITWILGPWRRTKRFPRADLRSVRRYTSPPSAMMWPSIVGRQLRLDVHHVRRPIDIGGGFELDDAALRSIEELLRVSR